MTDTWYQVFQLRSFVNQKKQHQMSAKKSRTNIGKACAASLAKYDLNPHSNGPPSPTNLAAWTCVAVGDRLLSSPLSSTSTREVDTTDGTLIFG